MASGGFSGCVLEAEKCSQLSFEEKRDLACKIAGWGNKDAYETLSSFTRRELRQIICAEMGKERKYSGYNKSRMINQLLKVVSSHNSKETANDPPRKALKRKRLDECHIHEEDLEEEEEEEEETPDSMEVNEKEHALVCQNAACRAALTSDDAFCKRCSCCICHCYDENKDPSLWLTCGPSDSVDDNFCGLTCHLICALKDSRSGIVENASCTNLEASFYCVGCGKVNELMRIWRKQLVIAMEARRVDVLCLRVLLGHKILSGSAQYYDIHKMLETGIQMLRNEVGPLDLVCMKMARGIVKRLSCGAEVQKLCASAVEAFDLKSPGDCSREYEKKKEPSPSNDSDKKSKHEETPIAAVRKHEGSFSPLTPSKCSETQEEEDVSGSVGWKRREEESKYEYSVRVIKWLEEEGEIEEEFRVKLLTWFSLKASDQERRVVNAFVDTLVDHPPSLAQQLKHAFLDEITCEPRNPVTAECCCFISSGLWH
ncbi:Protein VERNALIZATION INSENSITIVE 3 [Linum perenne]